MANPTRPESEPHASCATIRACTPVPGESAVARKPATKTPKHRSTRTKNKQITWVVGDIHGCGEALASLETRIATFSQKRGYRPLLVSVGDLVDRGPNSYQVVERFRQGVLDGTHAAVAGNHEAMMLSCLYFERPDLFDDAGIPIPYWVESIGDFLKRRPGFPRLASQIEWGIYIRLMWTSQGGAETLESYGCDPQDIDTWKIPESHLAFLASLPLMWQDKDCVVTHALADSMDLAMLRDGYQIDQGGVRRVLWSRALPLNKPDPTRIHISGHTPLARVRRSKELQLVRVDLGAFHGNRLAAWCPQLQRTVSVASDVNWLRGG